MIQNIGSTNKIKNDEGKGSFVRDFSKARECNFAPRSIKNMVLEKIKIEPKNYSVTRLRSKKRGGGYLDDLF